jgi:hypothetical protein
MSSTRPAYRFSQNAVGSTSNEYGNHILKRGMGEIRKPSWNGTETVVRLLPQWNFDENKWEPYRRSPAPMDFGDWIRRYDAVRSFGEAGITMLLYDPITNPAYDIQGNPCVILYRAINNAIAARQSEPDWPALFKGGNNKRAALGRHGPIYIARCGVFRINSKDMATAERSPLGLANSDAPYFIELPKTAGEKFIAMLEQRNEEFSGDPEDYKNAYKCGDPISLDAGAFVHIFEEGADPRASAQSYTTTESPRQLTVGSGGRNFGSGASVTFKGYDLFIEPVWKGISAKFDTPELERLIKGKQKPLDECFQFYSHQEQAFLVQGGFPPSAILYAWRDHPEWINDETRSKASNRVSAAMDPRVTNPRDSFRPAVQPSQYKPVVVPGAAEATQSTQSQDPSVGRWGGESWSEPEKETTKQDSVVPPSLDNTESQATVPDKVAAMEARAKNALDAARARAAGKV